jgi:hypothetical protein
VLVQHIQRVLPELRTRISQQVLQYDRELKSLGAPLDDGSPNKACRDVCLFFLTFLFALFLLHYRFGSRLTLCAGSAAAASADQVLSGLPLVH